jgi:hypothetical protein
MVSSMKATDTHSHTHWSPATTQRFSTGAVAYLQWHNAVSMVVHLNDWLISGPWIPTDAILQDLITAQNYHQPTEEYHLSNKVPHILRTADWPNMTHYDTNRQLPATSSATFESCAASLIIGLMLHNRLHLMVGIDHGLALLHRHQYTWKGYLLAPVLQPTETHRTTLVIAPDTEALPYTLIQHWPQWQLTNWGLHQLPQLTPS